MLVSVCMQLVAYLGVGYFVVYCLIVLLGCCVVCLLAVDIVWLMHLRLCLGELV